MRSTRTPVNWLRTFEVAARHESLSAAAAELNVTPAAVSQQVRLLELRLGEKLFVRHARGLRLTPSGEALVPACRESFERLDTTIAELFGDRERPHLVVRISLGFAREWMLKRLAGFSRAHPEIPMRILATIWAGETSDPNVDVEIRLASGPFPGMESHQLTHDEVFPVCAPTRSAKAPLLRRPSDLRHHPLLAALGFAQGWRHWFAAARLQGEVPPAALEFDSMRLSLEMVALGHGIALARSSYVQDLLRARRVQAPFGPRLKASDNIYLGVPKGIESSAPAALLRDWMLGRATRRLLQ